MIFVQQIKYNTLFLTAIISGLFLILGYIFLDYEIESSVNKQISNNYNNANKLILLHMKQRKHVYKVKMQRLASTPNLSKAINQKDYKRLQEIINPIYKILKKHDKSAELLTFRLKDGSVIYSSDKSFIYHQNNIQKKLILDTNKLQKSFDGFEFKNSAVTYNITQPIFLKDKYIGNIEIIVNSDFFVKDIKSIFNLKSAIFTQNPNFNTTKNDNKYIFLSGDNKLKYLLEDIESDGLSKINTDIVLKNYANDKIGYLAIYFDSSNIKKENEIVMHQLFFLISGLIILLGVVLNYGFNKLLKEFSKETLTDHLTGLKNRTALDSTLASNKNCVLILSNIRDFSVINELYGDSIGNKVLIEVAKKFDEFAKNNELEAFRISSDEYVLVKEDKTPDAEDYDNLLENLHEKLGSINIFIKDISDGIFVKIYSSITFNSSNAITNAQMALKRAKQNYLPYLAYSEQVDTKKQIKNNIEMKNTIFTALETNNVIPFFQPITDRNSKIIKYEALIRIIYFKDKKKNIIFPDNFLEIAKHNGQYVEITKRMIIQTLSLFADKDEKISINLTPGDLFNPSIMEVLRENIKAFGDPKRIIIEITEQESIYDFQRVVKVIKRLKMLGVSIAIDDFGSGYANYAYILIIKPDYLKIDGSLVKNLITDRDSQILVKSIVNFTKDLNIKTIAEYVENAEIFELLKDYGVDEFQGYYFR